MQIEVQEMGVIVDMLYYAMKILEDIVVSAAGSPGMKVMFIVNVEAKLLEEDSRKLFHLKTVKLHESRL
jgi:hypothetical protein